jgi:predicted TIM-barrel fold metal-dependent hydrolase
MKQSFDCLRPTMFALTQTHSHFSAIYPPSLVPLLFLNTPPRTCPRRYLPPYFTCSEYLAAVASPMAVVGAVTGGAIVSGSFQLYDQTYLVAALQVLGPAFVGVTQLPASVDDATVQELHQRGVRAVRFNLARGVAPPIDEIRGMALHLHNLVRWHVEFYLNSDGLASPTVFDLLASLPCIVIDHVGLSAVGFPHLVRLLEAAHGTTRRVYVKLTGLSRWTGARDTLVAALTQLLRQFPTSLVFGSDIPSTRAPVPFGVDDVILLRDLCVSATSTAEAAHALEQLIFGDNARGLYQQAAAQLAVSTAEEASQ